jgi:DNA-binding PadR family transcriptional regulator
MGAVATKISGTEAALLALLTRGEMSGYDLQRAAEAAGGFFWAPTKSRIYAVLPQLVERGYATSREVQQTGRPNKQLYKLTKVGRAAVQDWLEEPPVFEPERAPMLLKLYFGDLLSPEILLSHVRHIRTEANTLKRRLEAHPDHHDAYADLAFKHTLEWLKSVIRWASTAEREIAARVAADQE